jgi:hypothetical protein
MLLDKLSQIDANNHCSPLLLVQLAGGGSESAVQNTYAILLAGISMLTSTIMHLVLSLGTNQADSKKVMEKASSEFGAVKAPFHHLDEIKDPAIRQDLLEKL